MRPGQVIYCRYEGCEEQYIVVSGDLPDQCPSCARKGLWTTERPFVLNANDKRFLKSIRVKAVED